jgi:hypothetical protein
VLLKKSWGKKLNQEDTKRRERVKTFSQNLSVIALVCDTFPTTYSDFHFEIKRKTKILQDCYSIPGDEDYNNE